jgi:hypothetical protein
MIVESEVGGEGDDRAACQFLPRRAQN